MSNDTTLWFECDYCGHCATNHGAGADGARCIYCRGKYRPVDYARNPDHWTAHGWEMIDLDVQNFDGTHGRWIHPWRKVDGAWVYTPGEHHPDPNYEKVL